ncbi:MAG: BMP family ABC transporter substrate-binding protein [Acutalibacteraceae bacterium]|nr:BMP family ABC transporter substrate-binding protein [Acutalibacteraceae bacterium]
MKKLTRILAIILSLALVFGLAACGNQSKEPNDEGTTPPAASDLKVGFIYLHDENSTYDNNFIKAAKAACDALGVEYVAKVNIPESADCKEAALDLVDNGCDIIFADSFGHEPYIMEAAKECPDVQFCHATGTNAHLSDLPNFHNAFASIYEGRYLAGVAAGLKLNEMIESGKITADEAKMGYVGAWTYAEVVSGYTSFYLGAKSVCPTVTMEVQFTGSWYDEMAEKEAAELLINNKCVLISQHADSWGAPTACETAGVPNVSYNGSTVAACPNTFIISSRINWEPYFKYMIECVQNGTEIADDWCGGIQEGSVELSEINANAAAAGTAEKIEEVKAGLADGSIKVFDTNTFTVNGAPVNTYLVEENEVIKNGEFSESELRSAPYFDLKIDGIKLLNEAY